MGCQAALRCARQSTNQSLRQRFWSMSRNSLKPGCVHPDPVRQMKSALKIVVIAGVVGAFASFFFATSFYYRDLPSKPQPELGRIYPINNHGYPLYLTKQE